MSIVNFLLNFSIIPKDKIQNLFFQAIQNNNLELSKKLIDYGVDPHLRNDYALRLSSERGYYFIVKWLLQNFNTIDIHSNDDYAIKWSCVNGHFKIVKLLIKYGANIYEYDNFALKWCAINNHLKILKYLLNNFHFHNDVLSFIIIKCSQFGSLESIKTLRHFNANIFYMDNDALIKALRSNHYNVIKYLLENGANPTSKGNKSFYISFKHGHYKIIKLVIKYLIRWESMGYVKNLINSHNQYALIKSIKWNNKKMIKICLSYDADLSFNNFVPIKISFRFTSLEIIINMIDKMISDFNYDNILIDIGWELLELAINSGRLELVKLLILKYNVHYNVYLVKNYIYFNHIYNNLEIDNIIKFLMGIKIWKAYKKWKNNYPIFTSIKKFKNLYQLKLLPPIIQNGFPGGEIYRSCNKNFINHLKICSNNVS
jgi:ankyrin repeat protein